MKKIILIFVSVTFFGGRAWAQGSATGSSSLTQGLGYASSAVGLGMGGMMIKKACPNNPTMGCMMGVMATMQGMSSLAAATGDGTSASATTDCTSSFCSTASDGTTTTSGTTGGGTGGGFSNLPPAAQQAVSQLAAQGYTLNPDGSVTTPTGTYPASAFNSGASLAAAGAVTPDQGAAIDKLLKEALDKYKTVSMPLAAGGGAGGSGGGVKIEYDNDPTGKRGLGAFGKSRTSGLTRTLASGESIGAQVDDIFRMITAKYQQKAQAKEFVP